MAWDQSTNTDLFTYRSLASEHTYQSLQVICLQNQLRHKWYLEKHEVLMDLKNELSFEKLWQSQDSTCNDRDEQIESDTGMVSNRAMQSTYIT